MLFWQSYKRGWRIQKDKSREKFILFIPTMHFPPLVSTRRTLFNIHLPLWIICFVFSVLSLSQAFRVNSCISSLPWINQSISDAFTVTAVCSGIDHKKDTRYKIFIVSTGNSDNKFDTRNFERRKVEKTTSPSTYAACCSKPELHAVLSFQLML